MHNDTHTQKKSETHVGVVGEDDLEEALGVAPPDQRVHEVAVLCVCGGLCTWHGDAEGAQHVRRQ